MASSTSATTYATTPPLRENPEPMSTPGDTLLGITVGKQYVDEDGRPLCCRQIVPEGKVRTTYRGGHICVVGWVAPDCYERTPAKFRLFNTRTFNEYVLCDPLPKMEEAPGTLEDGRKWIEKYHVHCDRKVAQNKVEGFRSALKTDEDRLARAREDVLLYEKWVHAAKVALAKAEEDFYVLKN